MLRVLLLLVLGAIIKVEVEWAVFPGDPFDWSVVTAEYDVGQTSLAASGVPTFNSVDADVYETFGFSDRSYSTFVNSELNKYSFIYARETSCGWPMLALHGLRWAPLRFNPEKGRHEFTQDYILVNAFGVNEKKVMLGEREYLPLRP